MFKTSSAEKSWNDCLNPAESFNVWALFCVAIIRIYGIRFVQRQSWTGYQRVYC